MNKRLAAVVLAASVGTGAAIGLSGVPSLASAAPAAAPPAGAPSAGTLTDTVVADLDAAAGQAPDGTPADRLQRLKDALKGLVADGTLTQAQADKVATTLDGKLPRGPGKGPGLRGPHGAKLRLDAVAGVLGVTPDALRTALQSGKSLTDVAKGKGISRASLIAKLVAAAKAQLASDVTAKRLTQAQADERLTMLQSRIGDLVDRKGLPGRGGPKGDRPEGDGAAKTS